MPAHMPPKYSYAVLAASAAPFGGIFAYSGGARQFLDGVPFLLLLLSPFLAFALATLIAKRNVIVRFAVVLGCLFLVIDLTALLSVVQANASTSAIGLMILIFLELLVAVPILLAGAIAGRVRLGREHDGIV